MSAFPATAGTSIAASSRKSRPIGALWRRGLAFFIDFLLVSVAEVIISIPFFEPLTHIGNWSLLLGFLLALPYYVFFNSAAGGGQTVGKRILSLEVVDARGKPIDFELSLLRYIFFAVPLILGGVQLPFQVPHSFTYVIVVALNSFEIVTFYLICFNRRTRQGIHDLIATTYVVDARSSGPVNARPIWKGHWSILAYILLVITLAFAVEMQFTLPRQLVADGDFIAQQPDVQSAYVHMAKRSQPDSQPRFIYVAEVRWLGEPVDEKAFAEDLNAQLREVDPRINEYGGLSITIRRGFRLGFAMRSDTQTFDFLKEPPPAEESSPDTDSDTAKP